MDPWHCVQLVRLRGVCAKPREVAAHPERDHTWFGLFGPAGLPAELTQRLKQAFVEALNSPELRARMATLLAEPMPTTPAQFGAFVKSELAKYEQVVKASGARAE